MAKKAATGKGRGRPPGSKNTAKASAKKPGRQKKAAAAAEPEAAKEAAAPVQRAVMPSQNLIRKLVKDASALANQANSTTGEIRQMIGDAKEKHHLHTAAFAIARRLHRLKDDPARLRRFLDHLDYYIEALGLDDVAGAAPELELDGSADDGEAAEEAQAAAASAGGSLNRSPPNLGKPEEPEDDETTMPAPPNHLRSVPLAG